MCLSTGPLSHTSSQPGLCIQVPLKIPGSISPSPCVPAICPKTLPVRAWVPHGTLGGQSSASLAGPRLTCCVLCVCGTVALFWLPLEHAESRPGSLGTQTGAGALTCVLPARAACKCLLGCEGEELRIIAAEFRLAQKTSARR